RDRPRSHRQLAHGIDSPVPATWKDPGCAQLPAPLADVAARADAGGRVHQRPRPPAAGRPPPADTPSGGSPPPPAPRQPSASPRTTALVVQPPTTTSGGVKFSGAVRLPPGYSNGLVTSQGLTGQRRPDPDRGAPQLAVRVTGTAWVGKRPGRVWIPGLGAS